MKLFFLAGLTIAGYGFFAVLIFSFILAYFWLKPADKNKSTGCVSVGIAGAIIFFILMFPILISIEIFDRGIQIEQIAVLLFWVLIFTFFGYVIFAKDRAKVKEFSLSLFVKIFLSIAGILFLVLFFGMVYFLYLRFFTNEQNTSPIWVSFICIFFVAVIIFIVSGFIIKYKDDDKNKKEKTFYVNLDKAKLKPDFVIELDLSDSKLDSFPMEILQFKNIKFLILSDNNISEIPSDINKLKMLVGLDISRNPISVEERNRLRTLLSSRVEVVF
ncbi:leucine-rich repeat domain-containing protein [Flavobacterium hercynium]|uniref:Leucine-rich repeat domain-containing protein n=1 Tax=Flavobacterium hercynium TaxID=387094 RepID=A0A226H5E9_9FLAO|nr:leucine-rich repeat domain-containing protein [Flavobacterium hercynium]OXA89445.1 hypothetical protein B0A66_14120 [Flavobacterium hercynium]SMP37405.1 hypothetical protein SAMN06265346_1326 [Flavobacterium hercynium]